MEHNKELVARLTVDLRMDWSERKMFLSEEALGLSYLPFGYFLSCSRTAHFEPINDYTQKHNYKNSWRWPPMEEALRKLESSNINKVLDSHFTAATSTQTSEVGTTPFDKIKQNFAERKVIPPRLIEAMKLEVVRLDKKALVK